MATTGNPLYVPFNLAPGYYNPERVDSHYGWHQLQNWVKDTYGFENFFNQPGQFNQFMSNPAQRLGMIRDGLLGRGWSKVTDPAGKAMGLQAPWAPQGWKPYNLSVDVAPWRKPGAPEGWWNQMGTMSTQSPQNSSFGQSLNQAINQGFNQNNQTPSFSFLEGQNQQSDSLQQLLMGLLSGG